MKNIYSIGLTNKNPKDSNIYRYNVEDYYTTPSGSNFPILTFVFYKHLTPSGFLKNIQF